MGEVNGTLDEIEARAKEATEGPWIRVNKQVQKADGSGTIGAICNCVGAGYEGRRSDFKNVQAMCDSLFIAHAREDVPTLCQMVRERDAEIVRLNALLLACDVSGRGRRSRAPRVAEGACEVKRAKSYSSLTISHETMCKALQFWLRNAVFRYPSSVEVDFVSEEADNLSFIIEFHQHQKQRERAK